MIWLVSLLRAASTSASEVANCCSAATPVGAAKLEAASLTSWHADPAAPQSLPFPEAVSSDVLSSSDTEVSSRSSLSSLASLGSCSSAYVLQPMLLAVAIPAAPLAASPVPPGGAVLPLLALLPCLNLEPSCLSCGVLPVALVLPPLMTWMCLFALFFRA